MKNIRLILTFILIALTLIVLPQVSAAKVCELKWADHFPPNHDMAILGDKFGEIVAEKTSGQVEIKVFHAQTLSKARETIGALQAGVCDIISCVAVNREQLDYKAWPIVGDAEALYAKTDVRICDRD